MNTPQSQYEQNIIQIPGCIGSASSQFDDTLVIASILHSDARDNTKLFTVNWNQGCQPEKFNFYQSIVENLFNKICSDKFDRKFLIRLWISSGKWTISCAINATMLAILDAGIPSDKILAAVQTNQETDEQGNFDLLVYDQNKKLVFKSTFNQKSKKHEDLSEIDTIRTNILFEIEHKFGF